MRLIRTFRPLPATPASRHWPPAPQPLPVHPTELLGSSFTAFLLAALLIASSYKGLLHLDGRVFALMLMLEGRFAIFLS